MDLDFSYRVKETVFIHYRSGLKYRRVPEAAVKAILAANAGKIVVKQVHGE